MKRCWIEGEALDDILLSAHAATAAGHETHTKIPGATLLGAAAAALYRSLPPDDAWTLFHSGAFRFGDLRPMADGLASVPVPFSWCRAKGQVVEDSLGRFDAPAINDLSNASASQPAGSTAIRSGYVTSRGDWVRPRTREHLKSARDPRSRRARDQFLFGSQGISAGTTFGGWFSWDETVPESLVAEVRRVLVDGGAVRVGRSRTAEFGRLRLAVTDATSAAPPAATDPAGLLVPVLLLSDLQLDDPVRGPTLLPTADLLGLPAGEFVEALSHVAARRYRPFNGHRRRPDLARTVLQAGSVLVFRLATPLSPGASERLSQARVGRSTQEGLGEILVAPAMMTSVHPSFSDTIATAPARISRPSVTPESLNDPLALWAANRLRASRSAATAIDIGDETTEAVLCLLRGSLKADADSDRLERWPPPSQWKRLRAMAEQATSEADLRERVAEVIDEGISRRAWNLELWTRAGSKSLADVVKEAISSGPLEDRRAVVRRITGRMARWLDELKSLELTDEADDATVEGGAT